MWSSHLPTIDNRKSKIETRHIDDRHFGRRMKDSYGKERVMVVHERAGGWGAESPPFALIRPGLESTV
jgi:hypothetical protein